MTGSIATGAIRTSAVNCNPPSELPSLEASEMSGSAVFLEIPGGSIWLRAQSVDITQTRHDEWTLPTPRNVSPAASRHLPGMKP
jgi:hypothetical protein